MNLFNTIFQDFMQLLPVVLSAVRGVEHASTATPGAPPMDGAAKKAVVVGTVAAAATQAGTPLTTTQAATVANVNDAVVSLLNALGLLKAPVAPPAA